MKLAIEETTVETTLITTPSRITRKPPANIINEPDPAIFTSQSISI